VTTNSRSTICRLLVCLCLTIPLATQAESSSNQPAINAIESLLKKGGATAVALIPVDEELRQASSSDLDEFKQSLEAMPTPKLAEYVENLRRNGQYRPGPDSISQPGVPQGTTFDFVFTTSKVFPQTTRKISVYVPAAYRADKPACLYIGFDGLNFKESTVFDNLIFKHEMPVTIAVGIEPGSVPSSRPPEDPRFDRSLEFDALNGDLGRFVLYDVIPEVERHLTPDGKVIRLSKDANDRAVGGASTGGIAAFTLAWEHPESFRRVFTASGTYVGMRGGDRYAVLVRKTEPKPIRIFMQDGSHDELNDWLGEIGDWALSNQTLLSALEFSGYDVQHVFGEGTHDSSHATAIFPDAMRFLWKDWPKPIEPGHSQNVLLNAISAVDESWRAVDAKDDDAPFST
jgi:gluconolactonase